MLLYVLETTDIFKLTLRLSKNFLGEIIQPRAILKTFISL